METDTNPRTNRELRLLIITSDPTSGALISDSVRADPLTCRVVNDVPDGLREIQQQSPDIVIICQAPSQEDAAALLAQVTAAAPHMPVIMLTAHPTPEVTIALMREGAFDVLAQPWQTNAIRNSILNAAEYRRLLGVPVVRTAEERDDRLIGCSPVMQRVFKQIGRIAARREWTMITGPPGTGKRLLARTLHRQSHRADGAIESIRCCDHVPRELESILFDGCDGAPPIIKRADVGMLVLEDVDSTDRAFQSRLLESLPHRQSESGDDRAAGPIIAMTIASDIDALVASRLFSPDLYYACTGNIIRLPPLRERTGDLELLIEYYLCQLAAVASPVDQRMPRIAPEAFRILRRHTWPGNVTELIAVLRVALADTGGTIVANETLHALLNLAPAGTSQEADADGDSDTKPTTAPVLQSDTGPSSEQFDWIQFTRSALTDNKPTLLYQRSLTEMERGVVQAVLDHTGGNIARSARILGITRVSLRKKIHALSLTVPGRDAPATTD